MAITTRHRTVSARFRMITPDRRRPLPAAAALIGTGLLAAVLATAVPAGTPAAAQVTSAAVAGPALPQRAFSDEPVKYYRVQQSFNGEQEYLFAIAQRFLGDGNRNPEIFELNKGRVQPDGQRLTNPAAILPGWILQLPPDAKGEGIEFGVLPTAPAVAPTTAAPPAEVAPAEAAAPAPTEPGGAGVPVLPIALTAMVVLLVAVGGLWWRRRTPAPAIAGAPSRPAAARDAGRTSSAGRASGTGSTGRAGSTTRAGGTATAGGGDAAKGGVLARLRQRRGAAAPTPARHLDTETAWTVDRALRVLATSCARAGRSVPGIHGVSLDGEQIMLRLATADPRPVEPWVAEENGRAWRAPLRMTQQLPVEPGTDAPFPRLVTLGTHDGRRELVDLGEANGLITVTGDTAAARLLVLGWAAELAVSPWSDGVTVVTGGFRATPADTDSRIVSVNGTSEALTEADSPDQPASGPGVLILASAPTAAEADQVQVLISRPRPAWAAVALGASRQERWRFTVDRSGRLDTGVLGLTVHTAAAPGVRH